MNKKNLFASLLALAISIGFTFPFSMNKSYTALSAESEEIVVKNERITWVDASVKLPQNYPSIVGFKLNFKLLTDNTNYIDGYGGVFENPDDPQYGMKFPTYMLVVSRGAHGSDEFNENTFGCEEGENYEHYLNQDLAKCEIAKLGVGAGHYVCGFLDNGVSYKECSNMKAGDEATITFESKSALFEQGDSMLTFYGYTAKFEIKGIEWITGTPVVTDQEEWDVVEHENIFDLETVENHANQNGSNYVNIIKPKGVEGKLPVIFWIHGGAWTTSSRTDIILNITMEYFLSKGYAFVSAEYTLSKNTGSTIVNESHGKQMVYDLKLAVRFLRANADKYGLDTSFICAMGESAGAHLSMLLGTTNGSAEHEGDNNTKYGGWANYSSDVQTTVGYSVPTDISGDSTAEILDNAEDYPIAAALGEDAMNNLAATCCYCLVGSDYYLSHMVNGEADSELYELQKFLSPYHQVDSESAPMYIIHGEKDAAVFISQAYALEIAANTYMEKEDVKTTYWPEAEHVDKKYFDSYAQYDETYKFVEAKREANANKGGENNDPKPSNSKGCQGSIVITGTTMSVISLTGIALLLIRKRKYSK